MSPHLLLGAWPSSAWHVLGADMGSAEWCVFCIPARPCCAGVFRVAVEVHHFLSLDSMATSWALAESLSEISAHLGADPWRSVLRGESNHVQLLFNR